MHGSQARLHSSLYSSSRLHSSPTLATTITPTSTALSVEPLGLFDSEAGQFACLVYLLSCVKSQEKKTTIVAHTLWFLCAGRTQPCQSFQVLTVQRSDRVRPDVLATRSSCNNVF
jgi:hypothetical protein